MSQYVTRDIDGTFAVDAPTALITTGPDTTNTIQVPTGFSRISAIVASVTLDAAVVASKGSNFVLRLGGSALAQVQDIPIAGIRVGASETGTVVSNPFVLAVNIPVQPGNQVNIQVYYTGTDTGTQECAIGLEFS